jgi:quercetin dioxygenase-like cupin family protein
MLGKAVIAASLLALGLSGPAWAQDAPRPKPHIVYLHNEPVSGVPGKETTMLSIDWPPGATTGRHTHPGDEYAVVIEGAVELDVDGQPPRIIKAGQAYHNLAGVVFETKNAAPTRTRTISVLVTDKGQPLTMPAK